LGFVAASAGEIELLTEAPGIRLKQETVAFVRLRT
jgi:hypothetical protein